MGNFIYRIALGVQENNNILKFLICHFDFCILLFNLCILLFNLCALFLNFCILEHDGGVPVFYFGEDFIFQGFHLPPAWLGARPEWRQP